MPSTVHLRFYLNVDIDSVKVEVVKQSKEKREEKNNQQEQQQPKAITMAEQLKNRASLDKKTKLGDGSNITTIKQALARKEIWTLDNGISLSYSCHKSLEKIRTKMKNMFVSP